jgi:hypothetical protein
MCTNSNSNWQSRRDLNKIADLDKWEDELNDEAFYQLVPEQAFFDDDHLMASDGSVNNYFVNVQASSLGARD